MLGARSAIELVVGGLVFGGAFALGLIQRKRVRDWWNDEQHFNKIYAAIVGLGLLVFGALMFVNNR